MSHPEAYIVGAVRSPVGRKGGYFKDTHSADLGALVLRSLLERADIDGSQVEDVIFGCVDTIGPQAGDIARTSWLAAGLPEHVPGTVIDRQCGSSQQAVHFAAQAVMSGTQDLVVAGGVQNMSQIPIAAAMEAGRAYGFTDPFSGSKGWQERYGTQEVSQFRSADMIADKWEISREAMEKFALASHQRATAAKHNGVFAREIESFGNIAVDETPREDTSLEKMANLKPLLENGSNTAATSSQIADAAAALLIASRGAIEKWNLTPRARIHHLSVRADDPVWMLTAPIAATRYALERTGLTMNDIDLVEINEAFASVVLAWQKELKCESEKINVNGGAIALGHPLGATGARMMVSLLHELERRQGRYGLQTMCEGGGQANVTIIERLDAT